MGRKKIIYFSLLFILVVICTITYFSYAFLIKTEEHHGKLNIVTGTLKYGLTSENLTNNSITVGPGKTELKLVLRSLNKIDSKYQLYYQAPTGVVVGYPDTNSSLGTIQANDQVTIKLIINNTTNSNQTVTFGVEGGFTGNDLVLSQGTAITEKINMCDYVVGQEFTFDYNGSEQVFRTECDGLYELETWGAQGGSGVNKNTETGGNDYLIRAGGYGGYSVGTMNLTADSNIYINVGGAGAFVDNSTTVNSSGGYNGGGTSNWYAAGGGATHMALDSGLLSTLSSHATDNRILIVAGGGSGTSAHSAGGGFCIGGSGGGKAGFTGTNGGSQGGSVGTGGTQSTGYSFGLGQSAVSTKTSAGAGGGYYGGTLGTPSTSWDACGGGGSGYIANTNLINKSMYCYGCTEDLTNTGTFTVKTNGTSSYRDTTNCSDGYSSDPVSKCAKAGNGYAKITYLGKPFKQQILSDNRLILNQPTLTTTSAVANENGLYSMTTSNGFGGSGDTTYFFRGDVTNNVVEFAGFIWRIVRINEDGTVRLMLDDGINNNQTNYLFNNNSGSRNYIYYSNSGNYIKKTVNDWYAANITGANASKVAAGNYFCEAANVLWDNDYTYGVPYGSYTPNLSCVTDTNGKGYVNASVGLLTYDELVLAGAYPSKSNTTFYLYKGVNHNNDTWWWTMSPAGFHTSWSYAFAWSYDGTNMQKHGVPDPNMTARPVINLNADVQVIKDSITGHYVVQ